MPKTILEVTDLKKHFKHRKGLFSSFSEQERTIPAVDGVSFYLKENETVGLVGESGCGKTTIGRTILRLENPTSGRILFDGNDITAMPADQLRPLRGQMQMIFQGPRRRPEPQDENQGHPQRGDHRSSSGERRGG